MFHRYRKFMMYNNGRVSTVTVIFLFLLSSITSFVVVLATENQNEGYQPQDVLYVWANGGPGWISSSNFTTIQDAIDNASDTDTIYVWDGEYEENVDVNKTLTIIGNSTSTTIVNAGGVGHCFNISSHWANITGFFLNNTGSGGLNRNAAFVIRANYTHIYSCKVNNTEVGAFYGYMEGADTHHNNLSNVTFTNISDTGIWIRDYGYDTKSRTEIYNNVLINATNIYLEEPTYVNVSSNRIVNTSSDGIILENSHFNHIKGNYLFNMSEAIYFNSASHNNSIYNNIIDNVTNGGLTITGNNNTIYENTVKYSGMGNIVLPGPGDAYNNTIYSNNLIQIIGVMQVADAFNNTWNLSYPSGGNYWSNYTGVDYYHGVNQDKPGSDGIGDTNHTEPAPAFPGFWDVIDYYPLIVQYGTQSSIPITKNLNPANDSTNSISITTWNVTIESPNGSTFDWKINITNTSTGYSIAENSSSGDSNGSYHVDISGILAKGITYKVYVNVSTASSWTNDTYYFHTYNDSINTITDEYPANTSTQAEMYPLVSVLVNDSNGYTFNITWRTNATGSWADFGTDNTSVTNGTYAQRAVWANQSNTTYYWNVSVLNGIGNWTNESYYFKTDEYTWGDWSDWWQFNFSAEKPTNFLASSYNKTQINLTWTLGTGGADKTVIVRNSTGVTSYPTSPTDGTEIYNNTGTSYEDTGLRQGTMFYYSAWSWNNTYSNFSLEYDTSSNRTQSDLGIWKPYPVNQSTGVERAPTNLSAHINGTNININFWFYNLTPVHNRWVDMGGWTSVDTDWYEVLQSALTDMSPGTQFIWGDTGYNWSINITDGTNWLNKTFVYHTTGSRYDVTNSGDVISADVSACWTNRKGQAAYDGIYDVTDSGDVVSADVSQIWAYRT